MMENKIERQLNRRRTAIMAMGAIVLLSYMTAACRGKLGNNSGLVSAAVFCIVAVLTYLYDKCYEQYMKRMMQALSDMLSTIHDGRTGEVFSPLEDSMYAKLQVQTTKLTKLLRKKEQKSEEAKKEIKGLVTDIAHQLKTPLAVLKMYSDFLQEEQLTKEEREEMLKILCATIDKMEFLVESMIKMSRLESGVISLKPKRASIKETVLKAVAQVKGRADKKQMSVRLTTKEDVAICHDVRWTAEAVFNILENAVKYSKQETEIEIAVILYEMFVRLDITDHGIGLSEQEIPKIFQRFYRGSGSEEIEGAGIGLYLTRKIITMQGGYLKVSSKGIARGSTFSVFLPLR